MRRSDLTKIGRAERALERLDEIEEDMRLVPKLGVAGLREGAHDSITIVFPTDDPELNAAIKAAVIAYCWRHRAAIRQRLAELGVELEISQAA